MSRNSGSSAARGLTLMDRIDPDEHPVDGQELRAYLVGEFLVINSRRGTDASSLERLEDAMEPIVLGCRMLPRRAVAAPDNCNIVG